MVRQIPSTDIGVEALRHHDSYYGWLCKKSGINGPLAMLFFETDFRWSKDIPDDEKIAKKAKEELRERYGQHLILGEDGIFTDEIRTKIDRIVKSILGPACVFEVLVSLSIELDELLNMENDPAPEKYFERLISNLGIDIMDDEDYDLHPEATKKYWMKLINTWMDREFLPDGEGSLFPLNSNLHSSDEDFFASGGPHDQRKMCILDQLNAWVEEEI